MGTDSHKLQLMKASFFDEDCGDMMEGNLEKNESKILSEETENKLIIHCYRDLSKFILQK